MAWSDWSSVQSKLWGSGNSPDIYFQWKYRYQRSGADMQYQIWCRAYKPSGYYGYNIYCTCKVNGSSAFSTYLKNSSDTSWTYFPSESGYSSSTITVSNKTSGSTALAFNVYSPNAGTSRSTDYSQSMTVTAAGSDISASNGTLGSSQTISLTRYSTSFTDTVTYTCGSTSGTIGTVSGSTSSISWTPPLSLSSQNTSGTSVSVTLTTTTKSGSTTVQSKSTTITESIPSSVKPVIETLSISDSTQLAEDYGGYIQGISNAAIQIYSNGIYGSTITSSSLTVGSTSYSPSTSYDSVAEAYVSSLVNYTTNTSGSLSITGLVTDTRSRKRSSTSTITVLPYSAPVLGTVQAYRCNSSGTAQSDGTYVYVAIDSASITVVGSSSTNLVNSGTYQVRYRLNDTGSYTTLTLGSGDSVSNLSSIISGVATTDSINLIFEAVDDFNTTSKTKLVSVAKSFLSANAARTGLGVGKLSTKTAGGLEIGMETYYDATVTTVQHEGVGDGVFAETVENISAPSSVLPIAYGGTGATTIEGILTTLGIVKYVIETGTDNDWDYVKYNDGTYEAWYILHPSSATIAVTTSVGSVYRSAEQGMTMPSFSTAVTGVEASGGVTSQVGWLGSRLNGAATAVMFTLFSPSSTTSAYRLYVHARGTY